MLEGFFWGEMFFSFAIKKTCSSISDLNITLLSTIAKTPSIMPMPWEKEKRKKEKKSKNSHKPKTSL